MKPRFEVPLVLVSQPDPAQIRVISRDDKTVVLGLWEASKAVLNFNSLRIDFFYGDNFVLTTNARGMMKFEHLMHNKGSAEKVEGGEEELGEDEPDMWKESYCGHSDSKPNGQTAVAMDFTFAWTCTACCTQWLHKGHLS